MPDNTAKVGIDFLIDGALRKAEQLREGVKKIGNEGASAGDKMLSGLGKSLLTAGALVAAVKGVADAYNEAAANAAKLSRETGGRTLSSELAGRKVGLSAQQTNAVMSAEGSRTMQERAAFLEALGSATGPGGRKIKAGDALEAFRIFNEGTVDQGEIIKGLSGGRRGLAKLSKESHEAYAGLSETSQNELAVRRAEFQYQRQTAERDLSMGNSSRIAEARLADGDYDLNLGKHLPVIGAAVESIRRSSIYVAENTRPRLNTTANGP